MTFDEFLKRTWELIASGQIVIDTKLSKLDMAIQYAAGALHMLGYTKISVDQLADYIKLTIGDISELSAVTFYDPEVSE